MVNSISTLQDLITALSSLFGLLIPLAVGIGVLVFFWGIARYVYSAGSEEGKKNGKFIMVWGIIVIFIMTSLWGIIYFLQADFGFVEVFN